MEARSHHSMPAGQSIERDIKEDLPVPFSPIPRGVYPSVTHISPSELAAKGVRLVLADLDNTLVPYRVRKR